MKTKTPADPAKLRELGRALQRVARTHGGGPRHAQLRFALLNSIHAGHWTAGDRLPTETDLAAATNFSMGTVQRALRDLTDEGVVRRQQVYRGVFVGVEQIGDHDHGFRRLLAGRRATIQRDAADINATRVVRFSDPAPFLNEAIPKSDDLVGAFDTYCTVPGSVVA